MPDIGIDLNRAARLAAHFILALKHNRMGRCGNRPVVLVGIGVDF